MWFSALDVLTGVLGSREAHQVLKTIYNNIRSSAREDGHNDARNMLS